MMMVIKLPNIVTPLNLANVTGYENVVGVHHHHRLLPVREHPIYRNGLSLPSFPLHIPSFLACDCTAPSFFSWHFLCFFLSFPLILPSNHKMKTLENWHVTPPTIPSRVLAL